MSRIVVLLLATLVFQTTISSVAIEASLSFQGESPSLAVIRGRAVCLDSAGREAGSLFGCAETSRFAFAGVDGKLYKFLPADTMTPLFSDNRVRQRELQIIARQHSGDQLEIIKVQSVKGEKLYDIFYYCDVCSITAYVPGLCPCCRDDLNFRETPQ